MNQILNYLTTKYRRLTITKTELSEELGVSLSTIDKMIAKKNVLPKPIKFGRSKNATIRFNIVDIAKYIQQEK